MLEYDPTSKLYLVKRVHVPSHILEEAASREKDGEEKGACEVQSTLCVLTYCTSSRFPLLQCPYQMIPFFGASLLGTKIFFALVLMLVCIVSVMCFWYCQCNHYWGQG